MTSPGPLGDPALGCLQGPPRQPYSIYHAKTLSKHQNPLLLLSDSSPLPGRSQENVHQTQPDAVLYQLINNKSSQRQCQGDALGNGPCLLWRFRGSTKVSQVPVHLDMQPFLYPFAGSRKIMESVGSSIGPPTLNRLPFRQPLYSRWRAFDQICADRTGPGLHLPFLEEPIAISGISI